MRLPCDVVVVSRLLPSAGMRGPGRAVRALLALGKPSGGDGGVWLLVSTARHRPGAKYQLRENIEEVISDTEEGKATTRLKEPEVDICLSTGDVKQLKIFMSGVKQSYQASKQEHLPVPNVSPRKRLKR